MKKLFYRSLALLAPIVGASSLQAGLLFYVPIPASESDPNSGISEENTYTTAIDGGNAQGTDRVINGITLYALTGEGQSASANNCSLTVQEGTVSNGGGAAESIKADGSVAQVVSDMIFNNEASDSSEQDLVLDPESLTSDTTYDLRVYICPAPGQNREVNLVFAGDGQTSVETGWFNEDDATTSPGGFQDPNQVYYISYRYTWDGDTTPGVTIKQRYGRTPFCLYALTNQIVPGEQAAAAGAAETGAAAETSATAETAATAETGAGGVSEAAAPGVESGGLSSGFVSPSSDELGVTSDTFYSDESLNSNGEWVDVVGYGKCWRPTRVSAGWRPYTNGRWGHCDDCGWTWISDENWGWCTYHYGRWCHTVDTGWCWLPGTVWSPAWVSWRRGTGRDCECIGWAPLPPEAGCEIGVGIGSWVDYTCGLGPDAYTFVNVVDFGADNFGRCGTCLIDRGRYVNIYEQTTNITNISYVNVASQTNQKYVNIYNGGPDAKSVNTAIQKAGGKEIPQIHVNRYDDPAKIGGGKHAKLEGNTLALAAPRVKPTSNPQHAPKVAATIPKEKVDKGWSAVKDPKVRSNLQNKIAQQNKGLNPRNAPAKLPSDVASRVSSKAATAPRAGARAAGAAQLGNLPKGAVVQQRGAGRAGRKEAGARPGAKLGRPGEHAGREGVAQGGARAGQPAAGAADATKGLAAPPKTRGGQAGKPGQRVGQQGRATPAAGKAEATTQLGAPATERGVTRQGSIRPGQSLKKAGRVPGGVTGQPGARQAAQPQASKPGIQGKGAQPAKVQKTLPGVKAGGAPGTQQRGTAGPPTGQQRTPGAQQGRPQAGAAKAPERVQSPTQRREAKPGQAAQTGSEREQTARRQEQQRQLQQQQAEEKRKAAQQKQAQRQQQQNVARQPQAGTQQKQAQQRQAEQQQKQRQQQAEQQQRQRQLQQAQQQQQQRQLQQQQAQQRQRQLQQAQQQQQQRQLQQQQAQQQQPQQQQRPPQRGRPTPTPVPPR
jgi:hypothetical protein